MSRREWFGQRAWAEAWARREPLVAPLVPPLLDALRPAPGERILDVGAGVGTVARAVAPRLRPGGAVAAVDISEEVLAIARRLAERSGVGNVAFHAADAQRDIFPDAPYDAAVSLLGVMFFDDPVVAFANIRRHLHPGGRFAFTCWAEPERNPLLAEQLLAPFRTLDAWDDGAADGGSFSLANPDTVRDVLARAGWVDIDIRTHAYRVVVPRSAVFDAALLALYRVPNERMSEAWAHVEDRLDAFSVGDQEVAVELVVNTCVARAPA